MKITAIELVVGKLCQMYVLIKISQWEADELSRLTRAPQNGPTIGFSHRLGNLANLDFIIRPRGKILNFIRRQIERKTVDH